MAGEPAFTRQQKLFILRDLLYRNIGPFEPETKPEDFVSVLALFGLANLAAHREPNALTALQGVREGLKTHGLTFEEYICGIEDK